MPPVGGWGSEKICLPDFERAIQNHNFCNVEDGGANQRGIGYKTF